MQIKIIFLITFVFTCLFNYSRAATLENAYKTAQVKTKIYTENSQKDALDKTYEIKPTKKQIEHFKKKFDNMPNIMEIGKYGNEKLKPIVKYYCAKDGHIEINLGEVCHPLLHGKQYGYKKCFYNHKLRRFTLCIPNILCWNLLKKSECEILRESLGNDYIQCENFNNREYAKILLSEKDIASFEGKTYIEYTNHLNQWVNLKFGSINRNDAAIDLMLAKFELYLEIMDGKRPYDIVKTKLCPNENLDSVVTYPLLLDPSDNFFYDYIAKLFILADYLNMKPFAKAEGIGHGTETVVVYFTHKRGTLGIANYVLSYYAAKNNALKFDRYCEDIYYFKKYFDEKIKKPYFISLENGDFPIIHHPNNILFEVSDKPPKNSNIIHIRESYNYNGELYNEYVFRRK